MSVNKIATRYAKSLLDLSIDQGKLETVLGDIQGIRKALESRDLYLLMKSPIVNTAKKLTIFDKIFTGQVDNVTMSFINLMTQKGRESLFPEIMDSFVDLYNSHKKISKVIITTAETLGTVELEKIKAKLHESHVTMDNLDIETKVDPSIIGGFVLEIGDKLYDASVAHKLDTLKKQFSDNDYAAQI